jgi:cytidylate kinase
MAAKVITIARTIASGGEEAGHIVAEQLGFRYADDEIINEAAARAGVSRETIARTEKKQGLIARIIETMGQVPLDPQVYYGQALSPVPPVESSDYEQLIQDVIRETANAGNVVIVAHGAGMCLAGSPRLLRSFVTASPATRAARLAAQASLDLKRAEKAVKDADAGREDFFRRFYEVSHETPWQYDVVVNTDQLAVPQAAALIVAAAKL